MWLNSPRGDSSSLPPAKVQAQRLTYIEVPLISSSSSGKGSTHTQLDPLEKAWHQDFCNMSERRNHSGIQSWNLSSSSAPGWLWGKLLNHWGSVSSSTKWEWPSLPHGVMERTRCQHAHLWPLFYRECLIQGSYYMFLSFILKVTRTNTKANMNINTSTNDISHCTFIILGCWALSFH